MSASQPALFNVQEFTDNGITLVGGRLYTYIYGTTTLKVAYTDPDGLIPQTYTADGLGGQYIALNARGELSTSLYLGVGPYDISLKRQDGTMVWMRKAEGVDAGLLSLADTGGAAKIGSAAWYAGVILGFDATKLPDGATITFSGRGVSNDGGGGTFTYNKTSTQAADNGMVYAPTGGGRLHRQGWTIFGFNGPVLPEWFGAKGDRNTNDQPALKLASDAIQAFPCGGTLELSTGRAYAVGSTWTIPKLADKSILIEGNGAVILNKTDFNGNLMYFGAATDTGGFPICVRNVVFRSSTVNANAVLLEWASSSEFISCRFIGFANGLYLTNTFALVVDKCGFFGCTTAGMQSATIAHHTVVIASQFSGCARDIYFREQAHNLVLVANDFEGGAACLVLEKGGSAVSVYGGYIEGKTSQPILFGQPVVGFSMTGVWLGYNVPQTWTNIMGGESKNNTFWNQQQTIGTSCVDFNIGMNSYNGTSNTVYTPFAAPTLINGFANFGFGFASAGYRKDDTGTVRLQGMLTGTLDTQAFILPIGYRPVATIVFPVLGDSGTTIGRVTIDSSGNVTVIRAGGRADIGSISFTAAG